MAARRVPGPQVAGQASEDAHSGGSARESSSEHRGTARAHAPGHRSPPARGEGVTGAHRDRKRTSGSTALAAQAAVGVQAVLGSAPAHPEPSPGCGWPRATSVFSHLMPEHLAARNEDTDTSAAARGAFRAGPSPGAWPGCWVLGGGCSRSSCPPVPPGSRLLSTAAPSAVEMQSPEERAQQSRRPGPRARAGRRGPAPQEAAYAPPPRVLGCAMPTACAEAPSGNPR